VFLLSRHPSFTAYHGRLLQKHPSRPLTVGLAVFQDDLAINNDPIDAVAISMGISERGPVADPTGVEGNDVRVQFMRPSLLESSTSSIISVRVKIAKFPKKQRITTFAKDLCRWEMVPFLAVAGCLARR
jgi:hypothetical protein